MKTSSKYLHEAVSCLEDLPGIGRRTAYRLAIHLLQVDNQARSRMVEALAELDKIRFCEDCHYIADDHLCNICTDSARDRKTICVVESIQDVMAIEETNQYRGLYHVLGGVISPIEGVGPEHLNIDGLINRIRSRESQVELILAISPTIDGETTMYYISKLLADTSTTITQIARGVAFGGELQYTDELTLARSIMSRTPYGE